MLQNHQRGKLKGGCQFQNTHTVLPGQLSEVRFSSSVIFTSCRLSLKCSFFLQTAHALGVAAAWVIQSLVQVYTCFIRQPDNDEELLDEREKFKLFGKKIYSVTIKCGFSLFFASIGAGLGALVHPMHGQWIGELRLLSSVYSSARQCNFCQSI
jgi:hypothetical protein